MGQLTYTTRTTHPRLFAITGDKTALTTRTDSASSWKSVWDDTIIPGCNSLAGQSNSSINGTESCYEKYMNLGFAGWIENSSTYHNKLLSAALDLAQNSSYWPGWASINARLYAMAMGIAYTYLRTGVITFSDANRKIIGDSIVAYCGWWNGTSDPSGEVFHGHAPGDWAGQFMANVAIAGESGSGFNYTTVAANKIEDALDTWYGPDAVTRNRMEVVRYFGADGGVENGAWYPHLTQWECFWLLQAIHTGFIRNSETPNSLQLNSVDYNPWDDESWIEKIGEYLIWAWYRNDGDYWSIYDSARSSGPWHNDTMRGALASLITYGGGWRKQMRWLRDAWQNDARNSGSYGSVWWDLIFEVPLWDPADTDNASEHPMSKSPQPDRSRLFKPPGSFWYRNSWDYPNSCAVNIEVPERYAYYGHNHLLCGAMQICCKNDLVLCHTGCYRAPYSDGSEYGGVHHRAYYQQSIAHSGVPLVDEPGLVHSQRGLSGRTDWPSGLGGQLWRQWWNGSATQYEPYSLDELLADYSGNAWKLATVTLVADTSNYVFLHSDIRRAYLKDAEDYGTSDERTTICEIKDLIITGESVWPIILRYTRVYSRVATWAKRQQFHSYRQWSASYPNGTWGDTERWQAAGYQNTAKCVIDFYNWTDFTRQVVGGGSQIEGGFYQYQFYYGGVNYAPTIPLNDRWKPDIGRYRLDLISKVARNEERWVTLIMPMAASDSPLSYVWVNLNDWYGVRFSDTLHEYRIHKTLVQAEMAGTDTTPPDAPTGLTPLAGNQQVYLIWDPNTEPDIGAYKVYYREKV